MKNTLKNIKNLFVAVAIVLVSFTSLAINIASPVFADSTEVCEQTQVGNGIYGGGVIDTCNTSITENDVLIVAAGAFSIGIILFGINRYFDLQV